MKPALVAAPPDERLGVGEQRRAGPVRVVVEVERDRPRRVIAPRTVALSAIELPTVAVAGCWLVVIDGGLTTVKVIVTDGCR